MFSLWFVFMSFFFGMSHDPADRTLAPKRPLVVIYAPVSEEPQQPAAVVTYPGNGK